jgi:hypothetical protein
VGDVTILEGVRSRIAKGYPTFADFPRIPWGADTNPGVVVVVGLYLVGSILNSELKERPQRKPE